MLRFAVARKSGPLIAVGLLLAAQALVAAERETAQDRLDAAADSVREALQREIYGQADDRRELLAAAAEESPGFAPAMWHQGYVRSLVRGWFKASDYLRSTKVAAQLEQYERERAKMPDNVEGNLKLADWCAEKKLADQERAHLARVIDLAPDHAAARARLGFVQQGTTWLSRAEIAGERQEEAARQAALAKWQPLLKEIRAGLEHQSPERRAFALGKLRAIDDVSAIPAMEAVFAGAADDVALPAVETVAAIEDSAATLSLTRFAVWWPTQPVREAAVRALSKRPYDEFVPQLLSSMYSPVASRFAAFRLPTGRIAYRHAFVREGQDQQQWMLLDTEYRRIALPGGSRRQSRERALEDATEKAVARERAAAAQNDLTNRLNDRITWVLKLATNQNLPAQPDDWWKWWNEHNEVFVSTQKPAAVIRDVEQVEIVDYVPDANGTDGGGGTGGGGSQGTLDCLAPGTLVWTAKGPVEVETIRVGDLVLAQHPETGELAYKPVLKTTVRPSGPLIRIEAGGETFETSGGHLFWVAGEGWVKARHLTSGQVLHSAIGPIHVSTAEAGRASQTHNLVVADFATYFVGYQQVLSHDNTIRRPTRALVPGLVQE